MAPPSDRGKASKLHERYRGAPRNQSRGSGGPCKRTAIEPWIGLRKGSLPPNTPPNSAALVLYPCGNPLQKGIKGTSESAMVDSIEDIKAYGSRSTAENAVSGGSSRRKMNESCGSDSGLSSQRGPADQARRR